jgi:hypothetical protein
VLLVVCAGVVATRLVYAGQPLRSDEGGYLHLARHWDPGGAEFLYGDHHVDRPPLLLLLFRVAALWEWDGAIRLLVIPFVLLTVIALARAGQLLAGARGARWAAVVSGALLSSPALGADQADGELFAVAFVAVSVAATLEGWRTRSTAAGLRWGVLAGATAAAAGLVKQGFLDAVVFLAVLVVAETVRERRFTERCRLVGGGFVTGLATTAAATTAWAVQSGVDPARAWDDLVAFRAEAWSVIWDGRVQAPVGRAVVLAVLAVVTMLVPMAWTWLRRLRQARDVRPVEWAVTGLVAYAAWAIVMGGSYWLHYLVQTVPAVALVAALVAPRPDVLGAVMRRQARAAVAVAVLAVAFTTVVYATVPRAGLHERTGEWLAAAAAPGDTAFVAYGHPSVLEAADLETPYPYLWSLSMRVHDADQRRLRALLAGPEAPTWIVRVDTLNSWGIDPEGRLRRLVETHYRPVAQVCDYQVLLRAGVERVIPPRPRC